MSATGPFANILSERAAALAVVAGAVTTVAEVEPDDGLEEVKLAGGEPVVVPEVTETVGSGIEGLLDTVEDVPDADTDVLVLATEVLVLVTKVLEEVAAEGASEMGPGPRLNRRINKRISIVNGQTGSDLRYLC
jgi:hypothetical protein